MQCWQDTAGTGVTGARKDGTIQVPTDGNMWNFGGPQNVHPASSNYPTTCQSKPQETQISNGNVSCSCKVSLFTLRRDAPESYTQLMLDVSDSLSYSYVFISFARNSSDINHQKSTNIIKYTYSIYIVLTIIHTFRFTKEVWLQISCSWPPILWLALLQVPWKKRPDPALMSKVSRFLPLTSFNWDALIAFDLTLQDDLRSEHIQYTPKQTPASNFHITSMCPCEKCSEVIAPGQGVTKKKV